MSRVVSASLLISTLLVGCAATPDDGAPLGQAQQAAQSDLCPMVWDPVCGKDGVTYSNVCVAGGMGNVDYQGVCVDPCAAVLCIEGTVCSVFGGKPRCTTPKDRGNGSLCMLKCAAPPDGCVYEGAVLSGPCNKLTCGTLVCSGTTL